MALNPGRFDLSNATNLTEIHQKYQKKRIIGLGSFGKAWLATDLATKEDFCMKEMSVDNDQAMMEARSEAQVHSQLRHPFIIQFQEVVKTPRMVYIVMEYADQGDLATLLNERSRTKRYLPEDQLMVWMTQIMQALAYIHRRGMIHRDVKSANIFLMPSGVVKLGDLGCARILDDNAQRIQLRTCSTPCGTPLYQAPEQTKGIPYSQKVDIWALGCVLYEACTLKPTFEAKNLQELMHKIRNGLFDKRLPSVYTPQLRQALMQLLTIDPYLRPAAQDMLRESYFAEFADKQLGADGSVESVPGASEEITEEGTSLPSSLTQSQRDTQAPTTGTSNGIDSGNQPNPSSPFTATGMTQRSAGMTSASGMASVAATGQRGLGQATPARVPGTGASVAATGQRGLGQATPARVPGTGASVAATGQRGLGQATPARVPGAANNAVNPLSLAPSALPTPSRFGRFSSGGSGGSEGLVATGSGSLRKTSHAMGGTLDGASPNGSAGSLSSGGARARLNGDSSHLNMQNVAHHLDHQRAAASNALARVQVPDMDSRQPRRYEQHALHASLMPGRQGTSPRARGPPAALSSPQGSSGIGKGMFARSHQPLPISIAPVEGSPSHSQSTRPVSGHETQAVLDRFGRVLQIPTSDPVGPGRQAQHHSAPQPSSTQADGRHHREQPGSVTGYPQPSLHRRAGAVGGGWNVPTGVSLKPHNYRRQPATLFAPSSAFMSIAE